MHCLVTGAGGFLGEYIVEKLLARGNRVRTFARGDYPRLEGLDVEVQRGDIRDAAAVRKACDGIDVVFHTAAVAGIWGPWDYFYGINTLGTKHVLDGCRENGVGRLVYTSSPSVTFDGSDQCGVDESAPYPTRWLCHYPHTKALAEQEVLRFQALGQNFASASELDQAKRSRLSKSVFIWHHPANAAAIATNRDCRSANTAFGHPCG